MFYVRHKLVNGFSSLISKRGVCGGQFDGRVALLTGSTDGIGLSTAKRLGMEGATVVISSRRQENVDRAVDDLKSKGIKVDGMVCHISKAEDRKKMFDFASEKYGGFDMFFQNAAINSHVGEFLKTTEETFNKIMNVNVTNNFLFVREAMKHLKHRDNPSIILHSSAVGYNSIYYPGAYAVSKAALMALMHSLLPELSKYNIRINTIASGKIYTNFAAAITKNPEFMGKVHRRIPMKRFGKSEEVSGVASFLFSKKASYVTGEVFPITGGGYVRI